MATGFGAGYQFVEDQYETARTRAEKRLTALLSRMEVPGDIRVTDGDPATAIVQVAKEIDADLVVMGATRRTGLRRVLSGSVTEKVVRAASSSVLVVRSARSC